jgi:RNA polymerase sigma-70 factor (subfamily 1)
MSGNDEVPPQGGDLDATIELVQRAKGGDAGALEALLDRYQPRVRQLVRQRLGGELRRELDSGDMVQEAMVEVLEGFERFEMRDEDAFVKWLSVLVENRLRELARFHRAQKRDLSRRVGLESPDPEKPAFEPTGHTETPSVEVGRAELADHLRCALQSLSARHREVIVAKESGLAWAEVAEQLGLQTPEAARMLHARARVALLKALDPKGEL